MVDTSPYHQRKELVRLARQGGEHIAHDPLKSKAVKQDAQRIKLNVEGGNANDCKG